MLVLARKTDESILLGDDIVIKVISIDKGVVKIGIDAPKDVNIIRSELLEDVKDSNVAASKGTDDSLVSKLSSIIKK